jgi:hypothetical protein
MIAALSGKMVVGRTGDGKTKVIRLVGPLTD